MAANIQATHGGEVGRTTSIGCVNWNEVDLRHQLEGPVPCYPPTDQRSVMPWCPDRCLARFATSQPCL